MRRLLVTCSTLVLAAPLAAQGTPADTASVHVVRPGDTLWGLAGQYLRNPYLWTEIYRANRHVVANPDRIFPTERLRIPGPVEQPGELTVAAAARADDRTVFFGTGGQEARSRVGQTDREGIPAVTPGDFYRAGILVREDEVVPVGRLVEVISPSVVLSEVPRAIQLYDRVFMKLAGPGGVRVGDRVQLLRPGRAVGSFGRIFASTGLAAVAELEGDVATIVVDGMHRDVAVGDLAIPIPSFTVRTGATPRPATGLEGRLLAFESPHAVQAVEDLAFVDLGEESGLREGDEFVVVLPRTRAAWGIRPEIPVARVQVVRVTRRTAAMRVLEMEHPALEPGLPVRLVGKMP